ncbi:VanW family protein [Desulfosporosinus youngiae]|uniref:Putative vancomycin resistance protein n=1 Tax=Desulfosporosinus youngiae DSM 17734 TaxID=768710 RepID=H5Y0W3_9FIRM|nr:VanW family protein [Desulfosporosinus youngiae]EHQ92369.1 putative vancomycin resistance protein [Desulfosporosinus youngiae DSM 17734]
MKGSYNRSSSNKSRTGFNFKKIKKYYIHLAIIFSLIVFAGLSALVYTWDNQLITNGVTISGVNIGNMTQDQAKETMDKEIQRLMDQTLKLSIDQHSPDFRLGDLGLLVSADSALNDAYDISRNGSILNKIINKISATKGIDLSLSHDWNDETLLQELNKNLESLNNPAVDASFKISPQNTMIITKEQIGQVVDVEDLMTQIKGIDIYDPPSEIQGHYKDQFPQVTAAQLEDQKITGLLASYTTRFDPTQTARSGNVRLAANALDKAVIKPGDTLSFNKIVGERTVEAGYKDAYVIVNGQFVPGLAGGICQVSSTLYNTGLLANLPVTQRSNHDLAISYVPLGQDATVAFPDLDLKFLNNTEGYLLLRSKVSNNSVTIELYGKVVPGQEVSISNTTESVIPFEVKNLVDETLAHGESIVKQEGQPGYLVKSSRIVKMNGTVVKTEPLKQSRYIPLPKIVAVGA